MRVNPFFMPVIVIVVLLGTVFVAQAAGIWSTSGRDTVDLGQMTPADIKGWMTLQQVMDGVGISQSDLYALAGIPANIPPTTVLKDLEPVLPKNSSQAQMQPGAQLLRDIINEYADRREMNIDDLVCIDAGVLHATRLALAGTKI